MKSLELIDALNEALTAMGTNNAPLKFTDTAQQLFVQVEAVLGNDLIELTLTGAYSSVVDAKNTLTWLLAGNGYKDREVRLYIVGIDRLLQYDITGAAVETHNFTNAVGWEPCVTLTIPQ